MKNDLTCAVVGDLLPVYAEGLTAPETNDAVERHLAGCQACSAKLAAMRAPEPEQEREETAKEVDYLKKVKRRGWKRVVLAVLLTVMVLLGALAAKVFLIGSPADAQSMGLNVWTEDGVLWVEVTSGVSANAYWGWETEVENGTAHITAREGLVSGLHPDACGKISVPLEGVEEVYLCGRLIWQEGVVITREVSALMESRTPYVGDPSALNRIAQALYNRLPAPYTMELETSARPYRWALVYPDDYWELNPAGDAETLNARLESTAPLMLALVDNLDEVAWTYPENNGQRQTRVVTLEDANARLPELTEAYNASNGTNWTARESIKDYLDSPASFQQLLSILEHRYETRRMGVDDVDLLQ